MKIDKNTQIGNRNVRNGMLRTGAKAAGMAIGGPKGAALADKIASNPNVQKIADNLGAKTKDAEKKNQPDIGQKKVQSSLANRARNLLNQKKKRQAGQNGDNSQSDNNNNNNSPVSNAVDDEIEKTKVKIRRKIIIKLVIIIAPILLIILFLMAIINIIGYYAPFLMPGAISEGSVSSSSSMLTAQEQNYYSKLKDLESKYNSECNSKLDTNLIHASLIYLYYQQEYGDVDYNSMSNMLDTVYSLLPSSCGTSFGVGGEFYNNLKDSQAFNNYYSVILKRKSIESILDEIFELGKMIVVDYSVPNDFIPENTTINIDNNTGTSTGGTSIGGTGNNNGSDNQITNVSFKEYLLGVVYANVSDKDYNNAEKIKSFVIVYTSNALAKGSLSVDTQLIALNKDNEMLYCNVNEGCSYVVRDNKIYLQIGGGSSGNGNKTFYNGKYYYKRSMDTSTKEYLSEIVDEVYGIVLLNKDGKYDYLDADKINSATITNYTDVLTKTYKDYTIKNLRENNYIEGIDFYNQRVVIPTIAYDQSDYRNVRFCGRTGPLSSNNIESSGCGVTAIAIVVSSYEKSNKYDPPYMSEEARIGHYCGNGIYGTLPGIFWNQAEKFGYKILNVGKYSSTDLNLVLSHLSSGHMVITNVGKGTFTTGGHYIVLTGTDPVREKVYVTDPYDRGNKNSKRKSGSGWYDFNLIAKEAYSFYIIWKE